MDLANTDLFDDPSIQTILQILKPIRSNKKYLAEAGLLFNRIADSDRKIIPDFYDCGTTSRAIFITLLNKYRTLSNFNYKPKFTYIQTEQLSQLDKLIDKLDEKEIKHIQNYKSGGHKPHLASAVNQLRRMNSGVMICSIVIHNLDINTGPVLQWDNNESGFNKRELFPPQNLGGQDTNLYQAKAISHESKHNSETDEEQNNFIQLKLGHVWVIEKTINNRSKKPYYKLYQSALYNYRNIDHMIDYDTYINGPEFLQRINIFLDGNRWNKEKKMIFNNMFHYLPDAPLHRVLCVFHWAAIEY